MSERTSEHVIDPAAVAERAEAIRARIADAGGDPASVTVVAVTKGFGPEAVRAAVAAGLTDIGESYAQELLFKAEAVSPSPRWHFVGRLQSNKVRSVARTVHCWQSIDRSSLVTEVARRAPRASVLVQVNASGERTKGGCPPEQTAALVEAARERGLVVLGLMAIGPLDAPEAARPCFRAVADLADTLELRQRSMGMSDDLEVAVQEGSTMVRVGTALFGPRPHPRTSPSRERS